ncbi:hypothetical protein [Tengunoibacter tsumagoiensis]|uniref:HEAT repeat domain-containing protein n=1 Tax=Tengunoibacter tsumagoiensis TaxID=2014871 RepID=A0A402A618_9CHLR|nr:hypothetical protein [Tengunoibacter tsumagoiensis]GCE14570.1 hypothetical protein KTT_44290 [Tengunoibacter tsumagoiensis]
MSSLQEQLNQIPWKSLRHAYGPAIDTPIHLLALLSEDQREREKALEHLWASICHQGSVYEASAAAAPFLTQILAQVPDEQKLPLLDLLDSLSGRYWAAGRDLVRLSMFDTAHQVWKSSGQFLHEDNSDHTPEWVTHACVGDGIPVFLSLLQSTHMEIVRGTLILLSAFQELNQEIVPALMSFILVVEDPELKGLALRSLGDLLTEQAPEWEEYKRLLALPRDQVPGSVRFAAAETFAKYHPNEATPEIIDMLVEYMLQPYSLNLQVLSLLGMPRGWQALITLLERGATNWILLDTIRVAEAVLDMVFFGGWVENREWQYRSKRYSSAVLKAFELNDGVPPDLDEIEDIPDLSQGEATFGLNYMVTSSYPPQPNDLLVSVWGYDKDEAKNLSKRYEREGAAALSAEQKEALRVVLRCEPLWQYRQNLMEIYGLPITQHKLTAFLLGGQTV